MSGNWMSKWRKVGQTVSSFYDDRGLVADMAHARSRLLRFTHFWILVGKSFNRNRGPARAASLAYTTLLALVPLLAVGVSVTTSMLQSQGEKPVEELISRLVNYVAPALDLEARVEEVELEESVANTAFGTVTNLTVAREETNSGTITNGGPVKVRTVVTGRERVVQQITGFIGNIKSGTLGATGVIALLFIAVSLLRTIEAALNDIWGVTVGRGWVDSIAYYLSAITLGPLLLIGTITLTTGPHLNGTRDFLEHVPVLGGALFHILPFVILSLGFAIFYAVIPNTPVQFGAALVGGIFGGCLWQLNNIFNVIYVSRVVSYTNIYGSLGVLPLFLVGMYFSWLILLFGAQVAYAWQNLDSYIQERQALGVSQRGREFIALRLMTQIARNFLGGGRPLSTRELATEITVPSQLVQNILGALTQNSLLVEVRDKDVRYSPARPLDKINAYEVLCALRGGEGRDLTTTDDETRAVLRQEFERLVQAEREAGKALSLQTLSELTAKQIGQSSTAALSDGSGKTEGTPA